ncbi:MAG: hypothetical protein JW772_03595 [Candidatus Diapherotrites archaeon]|nr:hypothetical protein [Candidatus Diapherotrites archaeon]
MPRGSRRQRRARAQIKKKTTRKTKGWAALEQRGLEIIRGGSPIRVPVEQGRFSTLDFNKPDWCSAYATRAAKIVFGLNYTRGHAWKLAELPGNTLVQRNARKKKIGWERQRVELSSLANALKPGRLLGIYFPLSPHNRPSRPYTHVGVYMGKWNGKHWVMHNVRGPRLEPLESVTSLRGGKGLIIDVIQPARKK